MREWAQFKTHLPPGSLGIKYSTYSCVEEKNNIFCPGTSVLSKPLFIVRDRVEEKALGLTRTILIMPQLSIQLLIFPVMHGQVNPSTDTPF